MTTYTWNISQTDYETSNGFITTAHWQCTATEEYGVPNPFGQIPILSVSAYSTCSWADGTPTIPYADVTMQEVLDWCWAGGVDKDATEASLANQIALLKNPVTASGTPWST